MSASNIIDLDGIELKETGVMTGDDKLCSAAHLLAFKVKIAKWPEYKEYYIDFKLEGGAWVSIVFPEDEFKKFVKMLSEVISHA